MGSENGKNAKNRKRKLNFSPEAPKKAYFRFRFLKNDQFPWNFNRKQFYFRRKSAVFSKFSRLHAPCGKKLRNLATGNGNRVLNCLKTLVFEKNPRIFSKNFEKLPVFSKKITGNGNRMLRNHEFGPKIKFFKASPQYFGKKLRNFSNFKPNKQNFFFRSKNPENLRGFCPRNRK